MSKTFYFLLTERDDTRIGVVGAATSEELNQKVTNAINSHFDIDTPTVIDLNIDNHTCGGQYEFNVIIEHDEDEKVEGNAPYSDSIFIEIIDVY